MHKTVRNFSLKSFADKNHELSVTECGFSSHQNKRIKTSTPYKKSSLPPENTFMVTRKARIYSKKQQINSSSKQNQQKFDTAIKFSNFEKLKNHAKKLQNSEILRRPYEDEATKRQQAALGEKFDQNSLSKQFVINNEFMSSKKVSMIDRYRQNIKKLNKKKIGGNFISMSGLDDIDFQSSFSFKQLANESTHQRQQRKKSTYTGAKKFYKGIQVPKRHHKSQSLFCESNLKTKAMQITSRQSKKHEQIFIICL